MNNMKKVITIVITICLLLGCLPAFARYDGEILFRGIPWETDVEAFTDQVRKDLESQGVQIFTTVSSTKTLSGMFRGYTGKGQFQTGYYDPSAECFIGYVDCVGERFQVAGILTDSVTLYAVPEILDGTPVAGEENTDVVFAIYDMGLDSYKDKGAVYDQLCDKLIQLYGDPDKTNSTTKLWRGENDTFCCLFVYNTGRIELSYGKSDLPKRMDALMATADEIDAENFDGL